MPVAPYEWGPLGVISLKVPEPDQIVQPRGDALEIYRPERAVSHPAKE